MVSPVEAQSLSSLTFLLANPPRYPRNPTHKVHDPLVLYIVRTPGSRDVFLTPLKPPTKASISLEAIQSCLYYLHVITPEDDDIRTSIEEQQRGEEAERLANTSPIHRKPLPIAPFANYPASQRPPTPPKSYPHFQPGPGGQTDDTQAARQAARGIHLRLNTSSVGNGGSVRRKPVGPRSLPTPQLDELKTTSRKALESPSDHQAQPATNPSHIDSQDLWQRIEEERPPALPPRTNLPSSMKKPVVQEADRIVLIRRDPSSSSQWNVGTITVASSGLSATVEIHTPGYQKFAQQDLESPPEPPEGVQLLQDETFATSGSSVNRTAATPHFIRTIDVLALNQSKIGRNAHHRNTSDDVYHSSQRTSTLSQSLPTSKCIFTSPWQGQCFFTTGLDGRSLKCRHALPTTSSTGETSSETVCELRFNLPWLRIKKRNNQTQSEGENSPAPRAIPRTAEAKEAFRRSVQRLRSGSGSRTLSEDQRLQTDFEHIKSMSNAADQTDRMDLSLGKEKAGGGFRGSSAKLGKLIIEDEGLKFADLAVGASMGIWWTHYSSSGEEG